MTEQQTHLVNLIKQRDNFAKEINDSQEKTARTRESYFRVQGAIDYLTQIMGVTLPEEEEEIKETPVEEG